MLFRNCVIVVASRRPRGKTLMARLLADFYLQEDRSVAAFDLNAGNGTLTQFLPEHVTRSAIDDLKGQMALFDRLIADDGITKIVDLGHTSFEPFFKLAYQFGFAGECTAEGSDLRSSTCLPRTSLRSKPFAACAANYPKRYWRLGTMKSRDCTTPGEIRPDGQRHGHKASAASASITKIH